LGKDPKAAPSPGGSGILFAINIVLVPKFAAKRYSEQQVQTLKICLMMGS